MKNLVACEEQNLSWDILNIHFNYLFFCVIVVQWLWTLVRFHSFVFAENLRSLIPLSKKIVMFWHIFDSFAPLQKSCLYWCLTNCLLVLRARPGAQLMCGNVHCRQLLVATIHWSACLRLLWFLSNVMIFIIIIILLIIVVIMITMIMKTINMITMPQTFMVPEQWFNHDWPSHQIASLSL